jgi:glyoxylase I family protein
MQAVLGIGGLFFRARDPQALARWYREHLGVAPVPTRDGESAWQQQAGPTAFAPFGEDSDYFGADRRWMINFRVASLEAMVAQLRTAGIAVQLDPQSYPHGRFARLEDPEGNPIELWEAAQEEPT